MAARVRETEGTERWVALFEQLDGCCALLRPDGVTCEVNADGATLSGASPTQLAGRPLWHWPVWRSLSRVQADLEALVGAAACGHQRTACVPTPAPDGSQRTVELSFKPLRDDHGDVTHVILQGRDVTELRRQMAPHEVTQQVRTQRLEAEKVELLKASERHKTQFLSILSHELRTPLNAIQGFGSVLEDDLAGPLTAEQAAYLRKILVASEHMLALVNDLLDMTALTSGRITLNFGPVSLAEVTRIASEALAPSAAAKRQVLALELPDDLPPVYGDARRLTQIAHNLLDNAIKYTPDEGRVTVSLRREPAGVRLEVRDTGIGIPADQMARIFQPFTQVDMSSTRTRGGVGLGLSIVRPLVEAHGGVLGVESAEDEGSRFWLVLPLAVSQPTFG